MPICKGTASVKINTSKLYPTNFFWSNCSLVVEFTHIPILMLQQKAAEKSVFVVKQTSLELDILVLVEMNTCTMQLCASVRLCVCLCVWGTGNCPKIFK